MKQRTQPSRGLWLLRYCGPHVSCFCSGRPRLSGSNLTTWHNFCVVVVSWKRPTTTKNATWRLPKDRSVACISFNDVLVVSSHSTTSHATMDKFQEATLVHTFCPGHKNGVIKRRCCLSVCRSVCLSHTRGSKTVPIGAVFTIWNASIGPDPCWKSNQYTSHRGHTDNRSGQNVLEGFDAEKNV